MTRVYLYTDQPIQAKGLEAVLTATGQFQLDGSYSGMAELVERLQSGHPDVLLLDLTPGVAFSVLSAIQRVARESKLVLWVNAISTELAFQAMGLGVRGILRKTLPVALQVKCLQVVHAGGLWFEKALADRCRAAQRVALSPREGELITLLCDGLNNKQIASTLQLSEGTVKVYFSHLFLKVAVKDRFELALFGLKNLTAGDGQPPVKPGRVNNALIPDLRSLLLERPVAPQPTPVIR